MGKSFRKIVCLTLVLSMIFAMGCSKTKTTDSDNAIVKEEPTSAPIATEAPTEAPKEIVTLRLGTHHVPGLDPHYKDDVTGEYVMAEAEREARIAAEEALLNQLGVVFEYVQFSGNTTEVLLQSVMANDPIADIAWMWGGSESVILAQNVLQKLDDYAYLFEDEESSWLLYDKVFDHNYFLGAEMRYTQRWPLVFNIDYIEQVDALKDAQGNTIYPTTLFEQGDWTWSTFKDYLQKIDAHFANSSAPNRPDRRINAYETDYRFAALSAAYSAGGAIYGPEGLAVNSPETKKGVAFIEELMKSKLIWTETYADSVVPGWTWNCGNFQGGESVFTDMADWMIHGAATQAADRGQSIGIVPWPREDSLNVDDSKYNQVMTVSDSIGILKGISPEKTELSLKAIKLFYQTYYTTLAEVDSISELKDAYATTRAAGFGFDIFHEEVGDSILNSFTYIANQVTGNDYADLVGLRVKWDDIVAESLYGVNGSPSYDVAIEAKMNEFNTIMSDMKSILSKEGANDNVKPNVTTPYDAPLALPLGSSLEDPLWKEYIIATDNIDGPLDFATMEVVQKAEYDFNKVGLYDRVFEAYFTDKTGNKNYKTISFLVYDPSNTATPSIEAVAEPASIAVDSVVADIKWAGNFIASATDAHGFDITRNLTADISELDTTTPGTYDVKVTVTDFVGNTAETVVKVVVAKAE